MMKKLLATALLAGSMTSAFAGDYWNVDLGGVTMKFLSMQASPRTTALSGAGVADPSRVSEAIRNPLATGVVTLPEFGLQQVLFGEGSADNFVSTYFGYPITEKLALSLGLEFLGYDNIEGRDENGMETAEYGAYSWAVQAGVANRSKIFNWGVTARFASQTIDDETTLAIVGDAGASFRPMNFLSFGVAVTNFGYATESSYSGESEVAPVAIQTGVTGIIPVAERWSIHVSADAYRRADMQDPEWRFGGEVNYREIVSFRMGYAIRPETENGLSAGIGLAFDMIVVDYGYSPRPAFDGGNHYVAVGLKF